MPYFLTILTYTKGPTRHLRRQTRQNHLVYLNTPTILPDWVCKTFKSSDIEPIEYLLDIGANSYQVDILSENIFR